ncbi:MAG: DUF3578 domain-containing protein [Telluria sp.]|nr:DUF3578 domain-containing protein [Telluria sp.]
MTPLIDVLDNYHRTKSQLSGKAFNVGAVDQKNLLVELPDFFRAILAKQGRAEQFKVEGSIGNGNMARVPWVGVFNRSVTESAQDGYYIVLLFSEDMKSCFLSLNQGVTAVATQYSRQIAFAKMKTTARRSLRYFMPDAHAVLGPIDLCATGDLGQGYQIGAIESYRYSRAALPSAVVVAKNFLRLLTHYDSLIAVAGPSLQTMVPINEAEFQQAVLGKAAAGVSVSVEQYESAKGGVPIPPRYLSKVSGYQRNADVAAIALQQAEFKCEIDPTHQTFISSAKKVHYVEAHHLVPMSQQGTFDVSLDVAANIVSLCATCHKLLHHGRAVDKRKHLMKLFSVRHEQLMQREILLDTKILFSFYNKNLLEDE